MRFLLDLQERANRFVAQYTRQPHENIVQDFSRDRVLTADEARRNGPVHAIAGAEAEGSDSLASPKAH